MSKFDIGLNYFYISIILNVQFSLSLLFFSPYSNFPLEINTLKLFLVFLYYHFHIYYNTLLEKYLLSYILDNNLKENLLPFNEK